MILAIIALISTPIIIGVIDKARKGAFLDSAYGVLDAGRLYFIDKLADNNKFDGETFDFTKANNLKLSGEPPAGGTLVLDNSGRQALSIYDKDKRWCATKTYEEEKVTIGDYKGSACGGGTAPSPSATPTPKPTPTPTPKPEGSSGTIIDKNTEGNTEGLFTDEYGNVRYRGKNAKNYITFNGEKWRIIGVVDGKTKLIRDEKLAHIQWNSTYQNEWQGSTAELYINGSYYNGGLGTIAQAQIDEHTYNVGGISNLSIYSKDSYQLERGTTVYTGRSTKWTGKIGFAYISDYGYAAGSSCTQKLDKYPDTNYCAKDNWMTKTDPWWTMTPLSTTATGITGISEHGGLVDGVGASSSYTRPVLHLKSSVKITGGDGTQANPYTLG